VYGGGGVLGPGLRDGVLRVFPVSWEGGADSAGK